MVVGMCVSICIFSILYRLLDVLAQHTGRQLFGLTKPVLERMFGADEGGRLYSQLLVQRNLSGVCCTITLCHV